MQYILFCIPNVLSKFYNNHYWFLILSIIMQTICHLTIWHNTNVVIYLHKYLNNAIKQDIRINLPNMTLCIQIFKHITRMYAFSVSHICHVWMIISVSYLNNWSRSSEVSNNVIMLFYWSKYLFILECSATACTAFIKINRYSTFTDIHNAKWYFKMSLKINLYDECIVL